MHSQELGVKSGRYKRNAHGLSGSHQLRDRTTGIKGQCFLYKHFPENLHLTEFRLSTT